MIDRERRSEERMEIAVPVEIESDRGSLEAKLVDVSRTGARLQIRPSDIGHTSSRDLSETALQVASALPSEFEARMHFKALGSLLHRRLTLMRIAVPLNDRTVIELGCRFDRALTRDEATALGVTLPSEGDSSDGSKGLVWDLDPTGVANAPVDPEEATPSEKQTLVVEPPEESLIPRFATGVSRRFRAYLSGTLPASPAPLPCWSDHLNHEAVRIRIPREGYVGDDVTGATVRFTSAYGNRVGLKLVEGPVHLWTGHARVCCVEVPHDIHADVLVTLAFNRSLRPAELRRMRLQALAV